jgi:hypothetical protein
LAARLSLRAMPRHSPSPGGENRQALNAVNQPGGRPRLRHVRIHRNDPNPQGKTPRPGSSRARLSCPACPSRTRTTTTSGCAARTVGRCRWGSAAPRSWLEGPLFDVGAAREIALGRARYASQAPRDRNTRRAMKLHDDAVIRSTVFDQPQVARRSLAVPNVHRRCCAWPKWSRLRPKITATDPGGFGPTSQWWQRAPVTDRVLCGARDGMRGSVQGLLQQVCGAGRSGPPMPRSGPQTKLNK